MENQNQGWKYENGETKKEFKTTIKALPCDVQVEVKLKEIRYNKIRFVADDGGSLTLSDKTEKQFDYELERGNVFNTVITSRDGIPTPNPASDYEFAGWTLTAGYVNQNYENGDVIFSTWNTVIPSDIVQGADMVFTAKFIPKNSRVHVWFSGQGLPNGFDDAELYPEKDSIQWVGNTLLSQNMVAGKPIPYNAADLEASAHKMLEYYADNAPDCHDDNGKLDLRYTGYFRVYKLSTQGGKEVLEYDSSDTGGKQLEDIRTSPDYEIVYEVYFESPSQIAVNYYKLKEDGTKPGIDDVTFIRTLDKVNNQKIFYFPGDKIRVDDKMIDYGLRDNRLQGYEFVDSFPENGCDLTVAEDTNVIRAYYRKQTGIGFEVNYFYKDRDSTEPDNVNPVKGTGTFDDSIPYETTRNKFKGKNYVFGYVDYGEGENGKIQTDSTRNVVNVYYLLDENKNEIPDIQETRYKIEYVSGSNGTGGRIEVAANQVPDQDVTKLPTRTGNVVSFNGQEIRPLEGCEFLDMTVAYEPSGLDASYMTMEKDGNGDVALIRTNNKGADDLSGIIEVTVTVNYVMDREQWTTVTFNRGAHGSFSAQADAGKQEITVGNQLIGGSFPSEPGITAEDGWVFMGWNPELPETVGAGELVYMAQYEEDVKGGGEDGKESDNIPDKYQTIFWYESADTSKGAVSVTVPEVHTFRDRAGKYIDKTAISPGGAVATAIGNNAFEYWTDGDAKDPTSDMNVIKAAETYLEDATFTAHFDVDDKGKGADGNEPNGVPDKYETVFLYKSADETKGTVISDIKAEVHVFKDADGNYTEKTAVSPKGSVATAKDGYSYDYWTDLEEQDYTPDMSNLKKKGYFADTTFIAYFDVDEIGVEIPDQPDRIPDKRQIKLNYVSENTGYGTVSGRVTEVWTIYDVVIDENGNSQLELIPANPSADIAASGNGRYYFNNWTDGARSYADSDEIRTAAFTESTTFTARFGYRDGGTGPADTGGTGDTGDSGGTTPGGRYTPSTGGPGTTTTITPEDVPLAPLPESPVDITLIDDGEVPLAPLPKTGQTSMRTTLTMMLSGIFVAVTALSKKHREKDS